MEAKPQDGSTVKGYRTLTDTDIAKMNKLKQLSSEFLSELKDLDGSDGYGRWIAMAKSSMQLACMQACRAVARPSDDS